VPLLPAAPAAVPYARTLTIHSATGEADGLRKKATAAAMLHLVTTLLPPGRIGTGAGAADEAVTVGTDPRREVPIGERPLDRGARQFTGLLRC
jgi:hypothetical protein